MEHLTRCDLCRGGSLSIVDSKISLCRCDNCGFVFRNPRPSAEEIARFYSAGDHYDNWLAEEPAFDALARRRLRKVVNSRDGGKLLDVGSGIGQFLHFAQERFEVEGTEISASAVRIARDKYHLAIRRGAIEEIDFGECRFDLITMFHVLEHVLSPSATLRRCAELLAPGGLIVIAVPNELRCWRSAVRQTLSSLGVGRFKHRGSYGLPPIYLEISAADSAIRDLHLSHFTVDTLEKMLSRSGFAVLEESLDPFYAASGLVGLWHAFNYEACRMVKTLSGGNIYDAIWIVARKTEELGTANIASLRPAAPANKGGDPGLPAQ